MTDTEDYKVTAINSFRLAVELFNRPTERGRIVGVLKFLNHSFEMLLKASILENGGDIRGEDGEGNTISFEKCVNYCRDGDRGNHDLKVLSGSQAAALLAINNQRDYAEHEQVQIQEEQLYLQSRQAVEIFAELLKEVFDEDLSDHLPERILPLATMMPVDMVNLIQAEISEIRHLLNDGEVDEARRRVKSLDSLERGLDDEGGTPSKAQLNEILDSLEEGENLEAVFPNVFASLTGDVKAGEGRRIQLGNDDGIPASYVPYEEIDEDSDVHLFTEKNLHDRFPLDPHPVRDAVREELGTDISWQKTKAVIKELGLLDDREYYREGISLGEGGSRDGYHKDVIPKVCEAVESGAVDPEEAWDEHKSELWGYD
ncbi:DUF3644 domain-containing protein [Haloarcula brevis]|uniref:DUF3644 domain-containing protein n=1 Tax=Haloarcula brevis TaxID=3111453 RepID=UPI00300E7ABA